MSCLFAVGGGDEEDVSGRVSGHLGKLLEIVLGKSL